MKTLALGLALCLVVPLAALADPVEGIWKTEVDEGAYAHVTFEPCGAGLCGTILRTFRSGGEFKSDTIGRKLVWDMSPAGGGDYTGGKIWQPSTDKVYKSKMSLAGDTLRVAGCVGPICKKQTWTRVK
ncbi:DUF2147 domain-containing protein [Pseudooceanicola sp. C21-150M6]|uniref:DUF2147 domain-containing protein n=1 Tax=Pseudooceanicola sp. C21-150M6 TaxID=3434355 RepID=UPI003D7FB7E6